MSDTIQVVRWSLGGSQPKKAHSLWPLPGREGPSQTLWRGIQRTGLEQRVRQAFHVTDPLWNGLWIDSPLNCEQCEILHVVLSDVAAATTPRNRKNLYAFLEALVIAKDTGEPLNVELMPPGHVDMGWITTFVHCPRCKAEGPFERWGENYPADPIQCPVCGHSYSPAATYACEQEYFSNSVSCISCKASYPIRGFSPREIQWLEDDHYHAEFHKELTWLLRVKDFYERYPELEGQITPHFLKVLKSKDPKVQELIGEGMPFAEISLPADANESMRSHDWSTEELEVIDYLRHNDFSLSPRLKFVEESIERLGPVVATMPVLCPKCGGRLK
jgi:hypothetical protein